MSSWPLIQSVQRPGLRPIVGSLPVGQQTGNTDYVHWLFTPGCMQQWTLQATVTSRCTAGNSGQAILLILPHYFPLSAITEVMLTLQPPAGAPYYFQSLPVNGSPNTITPVTPFNLGPFTTYGGVTIAVQANGPTPETLPWSATITGSETDELTGPAPVIPGQTLTV